MPQFLLSLQVFVCVFLYNYVCVRVCVYRQVRLLSMCVFVCMCVCVYVCELVCIDICVRVCVCVCVCTYVCVCVSVRWPTVYVRARCADRCVRVCRTVRLCITLVCSLHLSSIRAFTDVCVHDAIGIYLFHVCVEVSVGVYLCVSSCWCVCVECLPPCVYFVDARGSYHLWHCICEFVIFWERVCVCVFVFLGRWHRAQLPHAISLVLLCLLTVSRVCVCTVSVLVYMFVLRSHERPGDCLLLVCLLSIKL